MEQHATKILHLNRFAVFFEPGCFWWFFLSVRVDSQQGRKHQCHNVPFGFAGNWKNHNWIRCSISADGSERNSFEPHPPPVLHYFSKRNVYFSFLGHSFPRKNLWNGDRTKAAKEAGSSASNPPPSPGAPATGRRQGRGGRRFPGRHAGRGLSSGRGPPPHPGSNPIRHTWP